MSAAPIAYRHELDGLRAIAVLAVLGYHAGYNDVAGGFIGVDVFLVLSGYLITQQIMIGLDAGGFAPLRFWLRRARRLLPAMVPVLAFALVAALILKGDGAFADFAGHFLSAGFFYSNYQFASEAGYFARASDTNLLLHTWSLSLEWQFYLIMPPLLMILHRFGRDATILGLIAISAASLAYSEILIRAGNANWAFYATPPRFWEFAAGGVVALLPRLALPFAGPLLRGAGLALIFWMILAYAGGPFPGLGAGLPVLGTLIILIAPESPRDPLRLMLSWRWMQWVGQRSYAIYLIHWPLMVAITPSEMNQSEGILTVAIPVSILLGHLIYRFAETPVRTGSGFRESRAILRHGTLTLAVIAAIGLALPTAAVLALREALPLSTTRATITQIDRARADYLDLQDRISAGDMPNARYCSFDDIASTDAMLACLTDPTTPEDTVLLIGDSHGRDVLAAMLMAYPGQHVTMLHQSSCVPATYIRGRSLCFDALDRIIETLAARGALPPVILAARWWQGEHENVSATLATLDAVDADTLVIGPGPTFASPMETHATEAGFAGTTLRALAPLGPESFAFDIAATSADLAARAASRGAEFLDRYAMVCTGGACPVFDGATGPILYFDEQHLSPAGLAWFAAMLEDTELSAFLER
ncbi:acyltransferase family protein [Alterinioella nitratireducens]|uniref:acyltransferase family protein n=1 Tax=Alterinioella nitratireducens TaxID=2735915 RepID=UPI001554FBFF|nr:acyltransferase family protein [Alterinioella nitratireducens]NPD20111.1 acyltransferase [Alterinioella nitratireducens]